MNFEIESTYANVTTLDWSDYTVFGAMLGFSIIIGLYFGCCGSKKKSTDEYLLGGKDMKAIPVAWSLIASSISGISFVAIPSEIYTDIATYWLTCPALILAVFFAYFLYIPVLCKLEITSTYEYLEMRFNPSVRMLASWFYNIAFLMYLPTVIYIPSLTLSQVTGVNLHIISTAVTSICAFYTMIGGLKAVIWTDFLQLTVTVVAFVIIIFIGTIDAGGFTHVMKTGLADGKLNIFNFDPNIFQRNTFITVFFGALISWTPGVGIGQSNVQRFLSLANKKDLPITLIIYLIGVVAINSCAVYSGLLIYSVYYGCDPIEQQVVAQADQIFPYFVLDKIGYIPTLPGLFVAGVFSAALSTLSTALNSIAGTLYEDNVKKWGFGAERSQIIIQLIIVLISIFAIGMVFLVENLGRILSVVFIITSVTAAPVYVLFTLGMMVPICNNKGAFAGALSCAALLGWIAIGSTIYEVNLDQNDVYPENVNNCNFTIINNNNNTDSSTDDTFFVYKLSYMMYTPVGLFFGITVGIITSYLTGPTDPSTIEPKLISPPLRRFLPLKISAVNLENVELQETLIGKKILLEKKIVI